MENSIMITSQAPAHMDIIIWGLKENSHSLKATLVPVGLI